MKPIDFLDLLIISHAANTTPGGDFEYRTSWANLQDKKIDENIFPPVQHNQTNLTKEITHKSGHHGLPGRCLNAVEYLNFSAKI